MYTHVHTHTHKDIKENFSHLVDIELQHDPVVEVERREVQERVGGLKVQTVCA